MKKQPITAEQTPTQSSDSQPSPERPVPSGQERMVTPAEHEEVKLLLRQRRAGQGEETERSEVRQ